MGTEFSRLLLTGNLTKFVIFLEYFEVVEDALSTYSPECVWQIKYANQILNDLLKTDEGVKSIETKFE